MEKINLENVKIEPFSIRHIEEVTTIHSQVLDGWSMKSLIGDLANDSTASYVAVYDGKPVAFCSYVVTDDAELVFICTHQAYRGQGIASKLLMDTIVLELPVGINRVVLEVRSKNEAAISLYEKHKFVKLGLRKNFYSSPADDAVVMELYKDGVKELD